MSAFDLPRAVEFGGKRWDVRTDFRDVLTILQAFDDPDLSEQEKAFVCLHNLYREFEAIPREQYQAAFDAAVRFIDRDQPPGTPGPRTLDWTQDAPLIFPAVNAVAGCEVRAKKYLHWWTFCGYFMEIRDSTAATVFSLRQKRAKGKKLEKWEKEYWQDNLSMCKLRKRLTKQEREEEARLNALLGG